MKARINHGRAIDGRMNKMKEAAARLVKVLMQLARLIMSSRAMEKMKETAARLVKILLQLARQMMTRKVVGPPNKVLTLSQC